MKFSHLFLAAAFLGLCSCSALKSPDMQARILDLGFRAAALGADLYAENEASKEEESLGSK